MKKVIPKNANRIKFNTESKQKCVEFVNNIIEIPIFEQFIKEHNWDLFQDYKKVIDQPTSLTRVRSLIQRDIIKYYDEFIFEIRLVFRNSYVYFFNDKKARNNATQAVLVSNDYILSKLIPELASSSGLAPKIFIDVTIFFLDVTSKWKHCLSILNTLLDKPSAFYYVRPVEKYDVVLPKYDKIVKKKMDLGTIASSLFLNIYKTPEEFVADVKLVYTNCIKYYKTQANNGSGLQKDAEQAIKVIERLVRRKLFPKPAIPTSTAPVVNNKSTARLESLNIAMTPELKHECLRALNKLIKDKNSFLFLEPVDYVKLGLLDYPQIIKQPMDLGTVKKKLLNNTYKQVNEFTSDIELIFSNCLLYNRKSPENMAIRRVCKAASNKFSKLKRDFAKAFLNGKFGGGSNLTPIDKCLTINATKLSTMLDRLIRLFLDTKRKEKKDFQIVHDELLTGKYLTLENLVDKIELMTKGKYSLKLFKDSFDQSLRFIENDLVQKAGQNYSRKAIRINTAPILDNELKQKVQPPPPPTSTKPQDLVIKKKTTLSTDAKPSINNSSKLVKSIEIKTKPHNIQDNKQDMKSMLNNIESFPLMKPQTNNFFLSTDAGNKQLSVSMKAGLPIFKPPNRPDNVKLYGLTASVEKVLLKLCRHEFSKHFFGYPVLDLIPSKEFKKTYTSVIKQPMDLETIFQRLYSIDPTKMYREAEEVLSDLKLIYNNAIEFNSMNDDYDDTAKMTKLFAKHMHTYTVHLFHERDSGYPQNVLNSLFKKFAKEGKISIMYEKLYCFSYEYRDEKTHTLIDPDMDDFHRPNTSELVDKRSDEYLDEINLYLYIDFNDIINFNNLPSGYIKYTNDGPQPTEEKILYDERVRRVLRTNLRAKREEMLENLSVYESRIFDGIKRLLGKLTSPNKRSQNAYFLQPFDYRTAGLFNYPDIIKNPMDFHTISNKLENSQYKSLKELIRDIRLIFKNCLLFTRTNANDFNIRLRRNCLRFARFFEKLLGDFTLGVLERNSCKNVREEVENFRNRIRKQKLKHFEDKARHEREQFEKEAAKKYRENNPDSVFQPTRVGKDGIILAAKFNRSQLEKRKKSEVRKKKKEIAIRLQNELADAIMLAKLRTERKRKQSLYEEEAVITSKPSPVSINMNISCHLVFPKKSKRRKIQGFKFS